MESGHGPAAHGSYWQLVMCISLAHRFIEFFSFSVLLMPVAVKEVSSFGHLGSFLSGWRASFQGGVPAGKLSFLIVILFPSFFPSILHFLTGEEQKTSPEGKIHHSGNPTAAAARHDSNQSSPAEEEEANNGSADRVRHGGSSGLGSILPSTTTPKKETPTATTTAACR